MKRNMIHLDRNGVGTWTAMLLAGSLAGSLLVSPAGAQSTTQAKDPATVAAPATAAKPAAAAGAPTRYLPNRVPRREEAYFGLVWGVDSLSVRAVESGELIRFSFHVLDANKAKSLNDKKIDAFLISPDGHARLVVPSLEKVGMLRQINPPEAGKSYWMAFSNPGRTVKRGDRVSVVIGSFQAEGLVVE